MRLSLAATTVATLSGISLAATVCNFTNEGFAAGYWISAQGVPDIPGICGGLWDNLKQFADCIGVGDAFCGANEAGDLVWRFSNGGSCNSGMVAATWYDATLNQWGALTCIQQDI